MAVACLITLSFACGYFKLLREVGVLTSHGFEQSDIYQQAHNFEDAQIAAAWQGKKFAPNALVEIIPVNC